MPDVIADGRFGEDHGWTCPECGAATYLTDDQGYGLMGYNCEQCDRAFQVQYKWDEETPDEEYDWLPDIYDMPNEPDKHGGV